MRQAIKVEIGMMAVLLMGLLFTWSMFLINFNCATGGNLCQYATVHNPHLLEATVNARAPGTDAIVYFAVAVYVMRLGYCIRRLTVTL